MGLILDSNLESVDIAEAAAAKLAEELGFGGKDLHRIRLAVREGMTNAVVHGNRYDSRKKVHFELSKGAAHLSIAIRDEGEGFDMNGLPDPLADENLMKHSGRGLLMIREFMDEVEVLRVEPRGIEVRMSKRLRSR